MLVTIEYTALHSDDYRRQVIKQIDPYVDASRVFSVRNDFSDIWYELNNQESEDTALDIELETRRSQFPPNLEDQITTKMCCLC